MGLIGLTTVYRLRKGHTDPTFVVCMTNEQALFRAHLRSLRTALVGMAASILTASLIIADEDGLGFPLFVITLLICAYAFAPPLLRGR